MREKKDKREPCLVKEWGRDLNQKVNSSSSYGDDEVGIIA
jgi:hypothetical protein